MTKYMNEDTAVNALISDLNEKAKEIAKLVADNNLLEEENTQLIDGNVFLEEACYELDELIKNIIVGNVIDIPNKYLEDVRCIHEKDVRDMESRFAKETGQHKKIAAEKINEVALLKADVKRLEKLLKVLADDNMRLRLPVKECLDEGIYFVFFGL